MIDNEENDKILPRLLCDLFYDLLKQETNNKRFVSLFEELSIEDINLLPDSNGFYPIHYICTHQDYDLLIYFIHRSDFEPKYINYRNKDKETGLHIACRLNWEKGVNLLLYGKASTDIKNKDGKKAIELTTSDNIKQLFKKYKTKKDKLKEDIEKINHDYDEFQIQMYIQGIFDEDKRSFESFYLKTEQNLLT